MDNMIRGFINQVAINPNMVKVLVEVRALFLLILTLPGRNKR